MKLKTPKKRVKSKQRIVIIGAGPTGLGAAYRLKELGYDNFVVYEQKCHAGGICTTFKNKGFNWDLGGHVIFSHYNYFNKLFENMMHGNYLEHYRNTWIRMMDRWIPYPFQNHIGYLPKDVIARCLDGLKEEARRKDKPSNFKEWIINNMGLGIAKYFMLPFNYKVWSYPLHRLSSDWVAKRVSRVDIKEVAAHLNSGKTKTEWGPNAIFKYPLFGGVGEFFRLIASSLNDRIVFNQKLEKVNYRSRTIYLSEGKNDKYDILINTSPLDKFVKLINGVQNNMIRDARSLKHNGMYVVGIGINKSCPSNKTWIYFPEKDCPFSKGTYFSNYSPHNVPDNRKYYSLLCESTYSEHKEEKKSRIIDRTIQGLINTGLLEKAHIKSIVAKFFFDLEYAYPIPTIHRNEALANIQSKLERLNIYSRGRFGAWRYEIGNMDHSIMQGKEIADRALGIIKKESVWRI